jgi:Fur family transcriptional regulator, ferric uptake regulator
MTNRNHMIEEYLKLHGLRKTPIRMELLHIFFDNDFALSLSDIKTNLKVNYDRVTVYRALNSFLENGLLHLVPDTNHGNKYALCSDHCPHTAHQDIHVHFICKKCQKTFCLEEVRVPAIELSEDFHAESYDYTISGVCKNCQ